MAAATAIESVVVEEVREALKPVDREKTCPYLLRVFCSYGRHNPIGEYRRGNVPSNELQIYTWMDATLQELSSLIKEVNVDARKRGTRFEFTQVFPDQRGPGYRSRELGSVVNGEKGPDDTKTLRELRFTIGDFLDIAISQPKAMGRRFRPY
nr:EOG090X0HU3 [Eulimnadia texana]